MGNQLRTDGTNPVTNHIVAESGTGAIFVSDNHLANASGDAVVDNSGNNTHWSRNEGYVTEAQGKVTVSSGTSTSVTHGLYYTPSREEIQVTPSFGFINSAATQYEVQGTTATEFTIAWDNSISGNVDILWKITREL